MPAIPFGGRRRRGGAVVPFGGRRRRRGGAVIPFGGKRRRGGRCLNPALIGSNRALLGSVKAGYRKK